MVVILADCPGAAGIYHRVVDQLLTGKLNIQKKINRIKFDFACDYNELPLANEEGGLWSRDAIVGRKHQVNEKYEMDETVNGVRINSWIATNKEMDGVTYRKVPDVVEVE